MHTKHQLVFKISCNNSASIPKVNIMSDHQQLLSSHAQFLAESVTGVGSMGAPGATGAPMKFLSGTHTKLHFAQKC